MNGLYIDEKIKVKCNETNEKLKLTNFFNRKIFRVSDSSLTYRQLNNLEASGLFESSRKDKSGWRKMNFREIVYMLLVAELRKYGLKNNQLFGLKNFFLKKSQITDSIFSGCFAEIQMIFTIDFNGKCAVFDPYLFLMMQTEHNSLLVLTINDYFNKVMEKIGRKVIPIEYSLKNILLVRNIGSDVENNTNTEINNIPKLKRENSIVNNEKETVFELTPLKVRKI